MAELKREYVIPLRRNTIKVPKWRRSKRAMFEVKSFIMKHMKSNIVIIGNELNEKIWENGIKNPPGKVSVVALRRNVNGKDKVFVNLLSAGFDSMLKQMETKTPEKETKVETEKKVEDSGKEKENVIDAEVEEKASEKKEEVEEKKDE